jgi:hypothetical protein
MAEGSGYWNMTSEWREGRLTFLSAGGDAAWTTGGAIQFGATNTSALIMGGGTGTTRLVNAAADKNFFEWRLESSATSGTARGEYLRLYLTGGANGEALRAYTTNSAAGAGAGGIHGAHISLSHSGSGNIAGLGAAARATYHVPDAALTGTNAAVMAELFADGANSDINGTSSFIRAVLSGNATGLGKVEDDAYLLEIAGGTNDTGNLVSAAGNEPTWASNTYLVRCNLNGQVAYLVAVKV